MQLQFDTVTRGHNDEDIINQAAQPDIPYLGDVQLMDVAVDLNYTYADYAGFAKAAGKHVYSVQSYVAHREAVREQEADYMEAALDNTIVATHW